MLFTERVLCFRGSYKLQGLYKLTQACINLQGFV